MAVGATIKLETVGQIMATNTMRIQQDVNGLSIAIALLSSHTPGAPGLTQGPPGQPYLPSSSAI